MNKQERFTLYNTMEEWLLWTKRFNRNEREIIRATLQTIKECERTKSKYITTIAKLQDLIQAEQYLIQTEQDQEE